MGGATLINLAATIDACEFSATSLSDRADRIIRFRRLRSRVVSPSPPSISSLETFEFTRDFARRRNGIVDTGWSSSRGWAGELGSLEEEGWLGRGCNDGIVDFVDYYYGSSHRWSGNGRALVWVGVSRVINNNGDISKGWGGELVSLDIIGTLLLFRDIFIVSSSSRACSLKRPFRILRRKAWMEFSTRSTELWKCKTIIGADRNVDLRYNISDRKALCLCGKKRKKKGKLDLDEYFESKKKKKNCSFHLLHNR